ncbi:MAG: hypothetical protein ACUZ8E_10120 [Candidatus Anammoxibacter sp.]
MRTNVDIANVVKKKRSCLMCGKLFCSEGSFNRRCKACEKSILLRKKDYFVDQHVYRVSQRSELDVFDNSFTINSKD